MKKLLLLLLLIPNLVMGEWTSLSSNFFYDASTMELVNNKIRLMTYANVNDRAGASLGSASMFIEFNCKEKAYRNLNRTFYSMSDLQGEPRIDKSLNYQWEYAKKTSLMGQILDTICSAKN
ncbi:hypothetical protein HN460_03690 [bacterium]|nr:hypothetical protein [bacterium]